MQIVMKGKNKMILVWRIMIVLMKGKVHMITRMRRKEMTIVPRLSFAIISGFVEKCYLTLINIIAISDLVTVMSGHTYYY